MKKPRKPAVKHSYAWRHDLPQPKIGRITELIGIIRGLNFDGNPSNGYCPRKYKDRFAMDVFFHECGTPACMSGHAIANFSGWTAAEIKQLVADETITFVEQGAIALGLDQAWADDVLFAPDLGDNELHNVTNAQAIAALTKLLKTIKAGKNYTDLDVVGLWGKAYKEPEYSSDDYYD